MATVNTKDSLGAGSRESVIGVQRASGGGRSRSPDFELRFLRQLWAFNNQFREGRDIAKVTRAALRAGLDLLGAREGCVAVVTPGKPRVEFMFSVPPQADWNADLLTSFIRGGEEQVPPDLALGRLRRRGRMWGVLAVRAAGGRLNWDHREALSAIAAAANDVFDRIDQERTREVRARIDYKILEQLRPKDLFYQILHGLHSLTQYDHSASLWIYEPGGGTLEVVAETITWKKGKSDKIGLKVPLPPPLLSLLSPGVVYGFERPGKVWEEWTGSAAVQLAGLLDHYPDGGSSAVPLDRGMLCAPLATRERVLGLLKVAAKHSGSFGSYEANLIGQFLPHASIALQNSQRTASLEQNLIKAERKHAMADLARGVAHDVNNALGAVLPLVQQMRAELADGELDVSSSADDLRQIESSIQTSRRIFGGMLSFARGTAHATGEANIKHAIENTRAILKEGFQRRGIEVIAEVEPGLPPVSASQGDLEQLFLNLLTNSRDAMPNGGRLAITARRKEDAIQLVVQDSGAGIPPENLTKVLEPFFSTKPEGNGLGLSICRSIVWQMQGRMEISSPPGQGTRVTITIPVPSDS
jgi:signal transduction histidine kinase